MKVRSLKSAGIFAAVAAIALTSSAARATDTFPLATVQTFTTFEAVPATNTNGTFVVASTPVLSRITVDGTITTLNGSFASELSLRLLGPGGTPQVDIRMSPTGGTVTGIQHTSSTAISGSALTNANGTWTYQFYETFDDGTSAVQDCDFTGVTVTFESPIDLSVSTLNETFTNANGAAGGTPARTGWYAAAQGANLSGSMFGWAEGNAAGSGVLAAGPIAFAAATPVKPNSTNGGSSAWAFRPFGNNGATNNSQNTSFSGTTLRDFMISPAVFIPAAGSYRLRFDCALTNATTTAADVWAADDRVVVFISDDGGATWTNDPSQVLATYNNSTPISNTGQTETVLIPGSFNNSNRRIAFYSESTVTGGTPRFFIDNVIIEAVPAGALLTGSSLTGTPVNQFGRRNVTYTATLSNTGVSASADTTLSVPIQAGFTYVPASAAVTTSTPFATGALDDTGGNISLAATAIPNGESVFVTWQYESTATSGSVTTTATINDTSLGTPIDRTFGHTFRADLPVAAGSDIFYDVFDSTQSSPNAPVFAYETPTGTAMTFADDDASLDLTSSSTPALPTWPIFLSGNQITTLSVDHDGVLVANTPASNPAFTNVDLTLGGTADRLIAPFWDDTDDTPSNVRAFETGVAPNRKFVIDWNNNDFGTTNPWQFQVVFSEDSQDIVFQYLDTISGSALGDGGREATVGLRGTGAGEARQYTFNSGAGALPILDNLAIRYRFLDPTIGSVAAGQSVVAPGVATLVPVTLESSAVPGAGSPFIIDVVSAGGTAVAGTDYDAVSTQATISNPASSTTFDVNVLPRATRNGTLTVGFTLTEGAGSAPIQFSPTQPFLSIENSVPLPMGRAYGADFFGGASNEFYDIDPLAPTTGATVLNLANGLNPGALWGYGDFGNNNFSTFHFTRGFQLFSSNTTTFAETAGPTITGGPAGADAIRGLKFDRITGNWYIVWNVGALTGPASFGTIDIGTGVVTQIGAASVVGSPLNGIIIEPVTGAIFGFDTNNATDRLISIDKVTGVGTVVGPLGTNLANFSGDGDYDDAAGTAFYSGTDNGGSGFNKWFSVNTATGALTEIANLETALGLGQMSALGITTISNAAVNDWTMH